MEHLNKVSWEQNVLYYFLLPQVSSSSKERGRRRERVTNARDLGKLAPDIHNLHDPPLYHMILERFLPFPSKAASSFRLITSVGRNLEARVWLLGTATVVNKETATA